ncbi:MAG TPA: hypothetical protein VFD36_13500, partial [Kofleriaceae bacterium]|nr:hypothetical protein [Kofleriaceae bacterium]
MLTIKTEDRAGELTLLDHDYQVVATGIPTLEARLPPGIFKLRVRTGEHLREDYLLVEEEQIRALSASIDPSSADGPLSKIENTVDGTVVTVPRARLHSPAPLASTARSPEHHRNAAARIAAGPAIPRGTGASLFAFVRRLSPIGSDGNAAHPAQGMTLHDVNGVLVFDFGQETGAEHRADPFSGARIALDPGFYRLRVARDAKIFEQGLVLRPPWNVEIFLMETPRSTLGEPLELDLSGAAIFLNPSTFRPDDEALRQAEIARHGLMTRQQVHAADDLNTILDQQFANPMFGIFTAHLLLLQPVINQPLLQRLMGHLVRLLGDDHPDVEALAFGTSQRTPRADAFAFPPMLVAGWDLACRATAKAPDALAASSFAAKIATRRWNSFPWLSWNPPESDFAFNSTAATRRAGFSEDGPVPLSREMSLTSIPEDPASGAASLTEAETRLLRALSSQHGLGLDGLRAADGPEPAASEDDDDVSVDELVRATRLPATVLATSARALLEKTLVPEMSHRRWPRVARTLRTIGELASIAHGARPSGPVYVPGVAARAAPPAHAKAHSMKKAVFGLHLVGLTALSVRARTGNARNAALTISTRLGPGQRIAGTGEWKVHLPQGDHIVQLDGDINGPIDITINPPAVIVSLAGPTSNALTSWLGGGATTSDVKDPWPPPIVAGTNGPTAVAALAGADAATWFNTVLAPMANTIGRGSVESPPIHALVIGIDDYPAAELPNRTLFNSLGGCVRDALEVVAFLRDRLGVPPSQITQLLAPLPGADAPRTAPPTYDNIVAAWQRLIDEVPRGEQIYIHY